MGHKDINMYFAKLELVTLKTYKPSRAEDP